MSLTVSPAVKVFALVGLLATVALAGGMMFLGRPADDAAAESTLLVAAPAKAKDVAAKASAAARKPTAVAPTPQPKAKPAKTPAAPAAAKPKPVRVAPVAANGMPSSLMSALARNDVVVVALYSSSSKIDAIARDEARAGAAAARAGFVLLDVNRDQRAAEALTLKLGTVLRTPGVLVFSHPDVLKLQLDGFRDRETVAQAAQNALR